MSMRSAAGHLGRRLGSGSVCCRGVHSCHCSLFGAGTGGDAAQLQYMYRPTTMLHCYRVGGMSLPSLPPPSKPSVLTVPREHQALQMDTRSIATRVTEFESMDNLLKTLYGAPLGQKTKKNGGDSKRSNLRHLEQLHQLVVALHRNPVLAGEAWKAGLVPKLIEFSRCGVSDFERQARMALSLVGYAPPYSGRGLRILSVDGGGTR